MDKKIEHFNQLLNDQSIIWGNYTPGEGEPFTYIPEIKGWRIDPPAIDGITYLRIAVHDGPFHADDALATLLLMEGFDWGANIIRTRDPEKLEEAHFIVDVGEGLLDHHGARADRENRIAACTRVFWGIINNYIQLSWDGTWILQDAKLEYVASRLLEVVDAVASWDTGHADVQHPFPYVHAMSQYAQALDKGMDQTFEKALGRIREDFKTMVGILEAEWDSLQEAERLIDANQGEIIVFNKESRWAPVKEMLYEAKSPCVFYVSPDAEDDWKVLCAADLEKPFSGFSSRKLMPEKFRGLRDEELSAVTGIPGGIFCHKDGFISGWKNAEAARQFAELCLMSDAWIEQQSKLNG